MLWEKQNNFGIVALAMLCTLNKRANISVPKSLLINPLIMHRETIALLSRQNSTPRKISALIAKYPELFFNFDARYKATLPTSINSIQFLIELDWVTHLGGVLYPKKKLELELHLQKRYGKIIQAAEKISYILDASDEELYLNFRITL